MENLERAHRDGFLLQCCNPLRSGAAQDVVRSWIQEQRQFGFVLVSFFMERALLPLLLAPNGLLLYRTYTIENLKLDNPRGPRDPNHLLQSQELLTTYSALRILHYTGRYPASA
jgi:hypothetical protein